MSPYSILLLVSFAASSAIARPDQTVLSQHQGVNEIQASTHDRYDFPWPIKDVAIIGAGVSGLATYRALTTSAKFNRIRIFERDSVVGGNWHYTEEKPDYVPVQLGTTDAWWTGDYTPSNRSTGHLAYDTTQNETKREELERERRRFRQPKPVWWTLRSNTPRVQQQVPDFPWPPHEPWASHWSSVQRYLRGYASWLGVNKGDEAEGRQGIIELDTRVEHVEKHLVDGKHHGWILTLRKFTERAGKYEEEIWTEHFDAVVIASGRFNVPHIPAIKGLAVWQEKFPDKVYHSREYRLADGLEGKTVLVVGASASATGISADVNPIAGKSLLSVRDFSDDPRAPVRRKVHFSTIPPNTTFVPEIKAFLPVGDDISRGVIELVNGSTLTGVDAIIFGTGFRYAFPFLSQYHNSSVKAEKLAQSEEQPIITDGTHTRGLWNDLLYIDQPTLAFQNQMVGIQSFVHGKYAAAALARIWSGEATLPSRQTLWRQFWQTVEQRGGLGKGFNWLNAEGQRQALLFFASLVNEAALRHGGATIELPPDVSEEMALWQRARGAPVSPDGRNDFWSTNVNGEHEWARAVMDDW